MTKDKKILQLSLISIGLFLIVATYFLYPKITEQKVENEKITEKKIITTEDESSSFEDVEYSGLYDMDQNFTVKAEKAIIKKDDPNVVYMNEMYVVLYMNDGRRIIITSDKGRYNKVTYDCYFENNVKATDNETVIFSENLDLLVSKDKTIIYNNVFLKDAKGTLRADVVNYDFKTKNYQISMFGEEKVKIKIN